MQNRKQKQNWEKCQCFNNICSSLDFGNVWLNVGVNGAKVAGGGKSGIPSFEVLTYFAKPIANIDYHLVVCFYGPEVSESWIVKNLFQFVDFSCFLQLSWGSNIVYLQYQCRWSCHNGVTTHTGRPSYGSRICIEIFSDVFLPIGFWWKESLLNWIEAGYIQLLLK